MTSWTFSSTDCTLSPISSTFPPTSSTLSPTSSTLSPTSSTLSPTSSTLPSMPSTLPSTTFTSSWTIWVIFCSSASAIRASSCVNLSSFLTASSNLVLPANFFRNFFADPLLSSFVAIPKIVSTSTIISVIMSVIAVVGVTSV
ncbi:hypothetical protein EDB89DRAFT_2017360 [Lactarius sanguifluus]|nr:hypothetical protein EDB89DRAFT_2017360 [Lactarius sanguifluus]